MSNEILRSVTQDENGMRLDQLLSSLEEIVSRSHAQKLLKSGFVFLNGQQVFTPSKKVSEGEEIKFSIPPKKSISIHPEPGNLDIIFEDSHLIVVNKPPGIVVHPSAGHYNGTLVNFLMHYCKDFSGIGDVLRPGIVHRIDKDTSGLLVVAKNDEAHISLSEQFKKHTIKRQYLALVWGDPDSDFGEVNAALVRHPIRRKDMAIVKNNSSECKEKGKYAVTHWRVLERFKFASLLACRLRTGRTHQIRVHLSSIGHPLVGDQQYGKSPRKLASFLSDELIITFSNFCRQALHAELLGFKHPSNGKWYEFVSEIPEDFRFLLSKIQNFNPKI